MASKRINYLDCDKQNHESEPLSRVCVDKDCGNKTVICCICEDLQHKGHQTTPLKTFIQKIGSGTQQFGNLNSLYYSNRIEQLKISFFSTILNEKNRIIQSFNDLEIQAQIYFNRISQMTANIASMGNISNIVNEQSSNPKAIKSYFFKLMKLVDFEAKQSFSMKKQLDLIVESCQDKQKKVVAAFDTMKAEIDKNIHKVISALDESTVFRSPTFHWSEQLKGHKVKITGTLAEQTNMQSSGQRFALVDPGLSQFGKRKQVWGIKVKKFVGWIGLGICLRNVIKKANYFFNYTNTGHGSYLISSNGYSWSHSVKQFNSAFKTFQFTVNDTVYMEYDPIAWKLRFRKNQGPENFELSIEPPAADDSYHPCVNLCSTGDSVEIMLPGFPLSL